ncbi:hypothetical protein SAMN06265182_0071 [Persephonella hydrogeniphila]|uniref:Uncharacterized protein n=1 Tax=Persephonella hydrogeniphila TaxID=198703 RepID=A0A285MYT6_9AQUI|nr:hypothetical protein [Persephonella hydrogeniphila]SNZ02268.1 hypothetical protein SAMN06265182_0071 [Persephonella hydrogeniphila]
MEANTFFLGIIALCMVIITIGLFITAVVMAILLKQVATLLIRINMDYKVLSPKVQKIVENIEYTTSILSIFSLLRRKK